MLRELDSQRRQAVAETPDRAQQPLGRLRGKASRRQNQADRRLRGRLEHPHPQIILGVRVQLGCRRFPQGSREALREGCAGLRRPLADPQRGDYAALPEQRTEVGNPGRVLAIDAGSQVPAQLVGKAANLVGSNVLGCSSDHRPKIAQIDIVGHAAGRLGSIAPVGGTQAREDLLHDGEARLSHLTGLLRLLAGSALALLLGGLAHGADSLVRQPLGDCPPLRLKRGQPGVAVLASGSQARRALRPVGPVAPAAPMARSRALGSPVVTTPAPAASVAARAPAVATTPGRPVATVGCLLGVTGGAGHPFCEALPADVLDSRSLGLVRLGRKHLAHGYAVDAHLGLHPENIAHGGARRQQLRLQYPLRLARSGRAPRPDAVGAAARQHDVEAMRHALNAS